MKRTGHVIGVAALIVITAPLLGIASGNFSRKLTVDRLAIHVLNRLTFGPQPGDLAEVRRIGVDKWIDLQLHPERIAENPTLAEKLAPLDTLRLATWQIVEKYPQPMFVRPPSIAAMQALAPLQRMKLTNGSAEDQRATLAAFDPETRRLVLAAASSQTLESLPEDLRQEATKARQAEQEWMDKERRRLMPPLNDLLSPDQVRTARSGTREEKVALFETFDTDKRQQILRVLGPQAFNDLRPLRRDAMAANQPQQYVNAELIDQKLYRAIYSNRQLEEVLVDFWLNHFNVFNGKGPARILLTSYERDAIRPHVFGHFRDLLLATARHPAMLFYLDNWQSQVLRDDQPFAPPPGVPRPGLNENYGRELMELHTLGVDGGYTQQDVVGVARAFSGWTIYDLGKYAEFQFNPNGHDRKEKTVLGRTFPAGRGELDGEEVLDMLARHPSTAAFISKKLAQRFVADDPPQSLVDRMAETFKRTDGDLRAVLQMLFTSVEFQSEGAWRAKLRSPLEMVVSAVRAMNADVDDPFALAQRIADMGQPLYGRVDPAGYPNTGAEWASTANVIGRINFAAALTAGQLPGVAVNISRFNFKDGASVAAQLLGMPPSASTLEAITSGLEGQEATPSRLAAMVIASPDFQRR